MEAFGLIAFGIIMCYCAYPNKVKKLERDMRKIKNTAGKDLEMSKIINELVGKTCKITTSDGIQIVEKVLILQADIDWIKLEKTNKKNIKTIEIMRIDDIKKIEEIVE